METTPHVPFAAGLPGVFGLLPFIGAAGVYVWGDPAHSDVALHILLACAATTVSFLGGLRWGYEMRRPEPRLAVMMTACVPALAAWLLLALPMIETPWRIGGFIIALVAQWLWDAGSPDLPRWWSRLRTMLTLGAGLALSMTLETAMKL